MGIYDFIADHPALYKWKRRLSSFIGLHYMYIAGMSILGSILIYPVRNMRYIDALFMSVAACTQAGLNTVNLNEITLYQQIVIYILSTITNLVVINSAVVFIRLHWFEKQFEDIKLQSKIQSKLRRSATMAAHETHDTAHWSRRDGSSTFFVPPDHSRNPEIDISMADAGNHAESMGSLNDEEMVQPPQDKDIRFGELPNPRHERKNTLNPEDMFRSINLMQQERQTHERRESDGSDGPALVIKSPRDMELEDERKRIRDKILGRDVTNSESAIDDGDEDGDESEDNQSENSDSDENVSDTPESKPESKPKSNAKEPLTRWHSSNIVPTGEGLPEISIDKRAITIDDTPKPRTNPGQGTKRQGSQRQRLKRKLSRSKTLDYILQRTASIGTIGTNDLNPEMRANYLSWQPTVGRNSAFVNLSDEQKEELGGVEYRALKILIKVLVLYFISLSLLGIVCFLPWILHVRKYEHHVQSEGISPTWWAFFTAMSSFSDLGLTLTPESMSYFSNAVFIQIISGGLVIAGNTGFPCILRFVIWVCFKLSPKFGHAHESLAFLLDHPRRCFTLLFPPSATWWLVFVLFAMNGWDWIFYLIFDLGNSAISYIPKRYRVMSGLYQAICVRTAGLTVLPIGDMHPAVLMSYAIMMYISVLPIAISMRRTNVYEEQSLGLYEDPAASEDAESDSNKGSFHHSYVVSHLRRQLSFDLWFIALGLLIVCMSEGGKIRDNKFSIFDCLFEVISAYGTVGLSTGFKGSNLSLSGGFNVIGKLIICMSMVRGRHRGLPYALDRAILLQGEKLQRVDTIVAKRTKKHRQMSASVPISGRLDARSLSRENVSRNAQLFRVTSNRSSRSLSNLRIRRSKSRNPSPESDKEWTAPERYSGEV